MNNAEIHSSSNRDRRCGCTLIAALLFFALLWCVGLFADFVGYAMESNCRYEVQSKGLTLAERERHLEIASDSSNIYRELGWILARLGYSGLVVVGCVAGTLVFASLVRRLRGSR